MLKLLSLLEQLQEDYPRDLCALWITERLVREISHDVYLLDVPFYPQRIYTRLGLGGIPVWVSCSPQEYEAEVGGKLG